MSDDNPFRTPGLRPEDQSAFSPGGQFALGGAETAAAQRWLARRPGLRRACFWGSIATTVALGVVVVVQLLP